MGVFLANEKERYIDFTTHSASLTESARLGGFYRGRQRHFCVPAELATENLCSEFQQAAPAFFSKRDIKWHDGQGGGPSNHLCDSQVSCENFLFPFSHNPAALVELLRRVYPMAERVIGFDGDAFLTFEWIGEHDYLGEKDHARNKKRSRGANCTSADAAVLFEHQNGPRQMVLIEWKYTETYSPTPLHTGKSGERRKRTYFPWLQAKDSPLLPMADYTDLFYEPFYQFMRQQLLAWRMEQAHELGAQIVSVLHISPVHNTGFNRVTSPGLRKLGDDVATLVWAKLLRKPDRFRSISTEALFHDFPASRYRLENWWNYISSRYAWLIDPPAA